MNYDRNKTQCGIDIAMVFVDEVLKCFNFLVEKYAFEQKSPDIWGGREVSIEYVRKNTRITATCEVGSGPPDVVVTNLMTKHQYGLGILFKEKYPERDSRIRRFWYTSRQSNPAIAEVMMEYVDFFQKEGMEILSED